MDGVTTRSVYTGRQRWSRVVLVGFLCVTGCGRPAPLDETVQRSVPGAVELANSEVLIERLDEELTPVGQITHGGVVERLVRVRNVSGVPLNLRVASRSCGCIEVNPTESMLDPGRVAAMSMRVTTGGENGREQSHWIVLEATDPTRAGRMQLLRAGMSYSSSPDIVCTPSYLAVTTTPGARIDATVTLLDPKEWSFEGAIGEVQGLESMQVKIYPERDARLINVRLMGTGGPIGVTRGHVFVRRPHRLPFAVPVTIRSEAAVVTAPAHVLLDSAQGSREVVLQLRWRHPDLRVPLEATVVGAGHADQPSGLTAASKSDGTVVLSVSWEKVTRPWYGRVILRDQGGVELGSTPVIINGE